LHGGLGIVPVLSRNHLSINRYQLLKEPRGPFAHQADGPLNFQIPLRFSTRRALAGLSGRCMQTF